MSALFTVELLNKRKPSRAFIMRVIAEYIEHGHTDLNIQWGENWVEIVKVGNNWVGSGWIKDIGGDDIAKELNRTRQEAIDQFRDFLKDHVTISFIK